MELDAAEWCTAPVEKATGAVENAMVGGCPCGEEGWRAATLEHDGGWSGAVESAVAPWSRWSTPRRCRRKGAVNGEERTISKVEYIAGKVRPSATEPISSR